MVMPVGVLVSGRGSNLRALLRAFPPGHKSVRIVCVISNRQHCAALEYARATKVETHVVAREAYGSRCDQQAAMAALLGALGVELVVLAGFDQILTAAMLEPYAGQIINVHPSLLPAFAGTLHAQAEALAYGVKISGCTVHYVNEELDGGPIIAQAAVRVLEEDTQESLAQRILRAEHRLLPEVVELIAEGRIRIKERRVYVLEGAADAGIAERL